MSLLTRLTVPLEGEEKIAVHQFTAAISEFKDGHVTANQVFNFFNMTASEQSALTAWYTANIQNGVLEIEEVHRVLLLGEGEPPAYSANTVKSRLNL